MNAIIIDDERLARTELNKLLKKINEIQVVGEAANAEEGIEQITKLKPDLIFLDIQMPGKNGFEMLEQLNKAPYVIFTTAYDKYALKAFEVNALDYLQKPIDPKRLEEAVQKLIKKSVITETKNSDDSQLQDNDRVFIKDGDKCWFINIGTIRLFESVGNYAKVYFENNRPLILKPLNFLEKRLDNKVFFRANRKHLLNLKMIEKIEPYFNGGLLVELKGGEKVEVSRRQTAKFKEMMSL